MYCGSNKTALASQRQIADALLTLLGEMPYGEISVSAICKRADVSRQTFYSLFRSKDNVITFTLRNDCCYSSCQPQDCCDHSFREICSGFGRYITSHAAVLEILSRHGLMPLLRTVLREDFSEYFRQTPGRPSPLNPYIIDFLAAGITSIAETYILTGETEDPATLENIIYLLMRGEYFE